MSVDVRIARKSPRKRVSREETPEHPSRPVTRHPGLPEERDSEGDGRHGHPGACFTCGRPPTGRFADGSPKYDHGHRPDGTVWNTGPDDGSDPDGFVPPSERSLPGIARYAIVALKPGDIAPHRLSPFIGRWRRTAARPSRRPGRRGRAMGEVRGCPACRHDHPVGTTCLECPGCRSGDLVRAAEEVFGELLPRDAGERGAVGHPGQGAPSETRCEGDGGSLGREAGAVGSGPARRVLDGPRSTAIAGHTDSKGAAR